MARYALIVVLVACSAPARPAPRGLRPDPQLARFMREMVNVPYSIAQLAVHRPGREARVRRAALVLHHAVGDLLQWADPPGGSAAARDVFLAYAQNLEENVRRLELATRTRDAELVGQSLEGIRRTCNQCHRFFRPANKLSADVAIDQGDNP
ncbi:MAG: cytochrome c [Deltaproteobacteria bacterium]|nr:cytochrome c [Deltaproteobacteria bacterium]MCW5805511.1 cytochrome c [Deltaproteobacteria bacterium]